MPAVNNETFELDLTKSGGLMQALYLGQGDKNGTTIKVKITDNGELPDGIAGMVPYFEMMLPDAAHYYEVAGTLSVADGEAIATITIDETKAAAVPGITDTAYIALKSGSTVIASTERLRVCVLRNAADGVDPAQAWNNGIEEAVARANAAAAAAEGVVLQAVPTMSATVKGGAKLGTGLEMSGTNSDVLQVSQALRDSISLFTVGGGRVRVDAEAGTDWDSLDAGNYWVQNYLPEDLKTAGASNYGFLSVVKGGKNYGVQLYFSHSGYGPRYRTKFNSGWNSWRALSS